jgi:ATPase subunit of ABC transporter with duplicated ATPase domains
MISFSKISKQYGRQVLFVDASFQLNPGEKIGLVGPNGSGKTTLFRMIMGEEVPDEGDVSVPKKLTVGYFRQDVEEMTGRSVLDEAILGSGRVGDLHHELESLQNAMSDQRRSTTWIPYPLALRRSAGRIDHLGGYARGAGARGAAAWRGRSHRRRRRGAVRAAGRCAWRWRGCCSAGRRAADGRADQPPRHRIRSSARGFLKTLTGSLLMTSHDRDFMNRIDVEDRRDRRRRDRPTRATTISTSASARHPRRRTVKRRTRQRVDAGQGAALHQSASPPTPPGGAVKPGEGAGRSRRSAAQEARAVVKFEFRPPPRSGRAGRGPRSVTKSGKRVVHDGLNLLIRRGERWCVMGKNGAGKSTLLKMVAGQLAPDAGDVKLGASLPDGLFRPAVKLDLLDPI